MAAPVGFCRGFGPRFRVHLSHVMLALYCGFFRCFRLFGGFFEANWFLTLIAFDKKDNAVPVQSGVRVFGRAKTNYIISTCIPDDFFAIARFQEFLFWTERGLFGQDVR